MILQQIKNLYEGYKYYLFTDAEVEKMAEERMKICSECKDEKGEPMIKFINKKMNLYSHCDKCKCWLHAYTHAPEKHCDLGKF